jgi:hypothetical protein
MPTNYGGCGYKPAGTTVTGGGPSGGEGILALPPLVIGAGSQDNGDANTPSTPTTYEWVVTVLDNVTGAYKASRVIAMYNGSTVSHSVYQNITEGTISRVINVNFALGVVSLEVVNNGPNPVTVSIGKYPLVEI